MAKCVGFIESRESVLQQIADCNDYVAKHCYFCKNCWECKVTLKFNCECEKKGIRSYNSNKKWWSISWPQEKNGDHLPVLQFHDGKKNSFL